jgi:hypothetical protein
MFLESLHTVMKDWPKYETSWDGWIKSAIIASAWYSYDVMDHVLLYHIQFQEFLNTWVNHILCKIHAHFVYSIVLVDS